MESLKPLKLSNSFDSLKSDKCLIEEELFLSCMKTNTNKHFRKNKCKNLFDIWYNCINVPEGLNKITNIK